MGDTTDGQAQAGLPREWAEALVAYQAALVARGNADAKLSAMRKRHDEEERAACAELDKAIATARALREQLHAAMGITC